MRFIVLSSSEHWPREILLGLDRATLRWKNMPSGPFPTSRKEHTSSFHGYGNGTTGKIDSAGTAKDWRLDQVAPDGVLDQIRRGFHAEHFHDPIFVEGHGAWGEVENVRDFLH